MTLRCPSCNKFRAAENLECVDVDITSVNIENGVIYGELRASISVTCPECGEEIGTLEVDGVEVKLGHKNDIEQT